MIAADMTHQPTPAGELSSSDSILDQSGTPWTILTCTREGDVVHLRMDNRGNIVTADLPADKEVTLLRPAPFEQEIRDKSIDQFIAEIDAAAAGKVDNTVPPPPTPQEAAETVQRELGGHLVAVESAEDEHNREQAETTGVPMALPLWEQMSEPERCTHLYLVHGVWAYDQVGAATLTTLHDNSHGRGDALAPHVHTEGLR